MGCPRSSASDSKDESAYRHADCCKDARDRYPLFSEESSNSLSQHLVFMEEPPDGLTNSVDPRPESCSIRGEGFEPRLPFKLDVGELAFKLLHSVLNFGVVRFGQFSAFTGQVLFDFGFPVVDGAELREVFSELVPRSRHSLPNFDQFSSGLCDPRCVHWRVINGLQYGFDVFCALSYGISHAGEILQFDCLSVFLGGFPLHSGVSSRPLCRASAISPIYKIREPQRSPHCIYATILVSSDQRA